VSQFINNLFGVVGFVSGIITICIFMFSGRKISGRIISIFGLIVTSMLILTFILTRLPVSGTSQKPGQTQAVTPTQLTTPTQPATSYPHLASAYQGTVHNVTLNATTTLVLNSIAQKQQYISGKVFFGPNFNGDGPFTGIIDTNRNVTFTVTLSYGSIIFNGSLSSDGSLRGTFNSVSSTGQAGQTATWQTVPYQMQANPHLVIAYQGSISCIAADGGSFCGKATLILTSIVQKQHDISGNAIIGPGLLGSGSFTGTINANGIVSLTDNDTTDGFTIIFSGLLFPDGSLSGTYTVPGSGYMGIWQAPPA
jgi:hypothetical protein